MEQAIRKISVKKIGEKIKLKTMNHCKCIESLAYSDEEIFYDEGEFYYFDYVPTMGDRLPFYKVFTNGTGHHQVFDIRAFNKHFKRY